MRVVEDDVGREALDDPLMLKAVIWGHPFLWVPLKAKTNEVYKVRIR